MMIDSNIFVGCIQPLWNLWEYHGNIMDFFDGEISAIFDHDRDMIVTEWEKNTPALNLAKGY